jgi:hypothetical protein
LVKGVQAAMAVEVANNLISEFWGSAGARYARALYIKNKILTIACLSSSMAQEIKLREAEIVRRLNQSQGIRTVEKVRCLS